MSNKGSNMWALLRITTVSSNWYFLSQRSGAKWRKNNELSNWSAITEPLFMFSIRCYTVKSYLYSFVYLRNTKIYVKPSKTDDDLKIMKNMINLKSIYFTYYEYSNHCTLST